MITNGVMPVAEPAPVPAADDDVLLEVDDLVVEYRTPDGGKVHAVSGVSFRVRRGETLGLVGESGCGKSTVARAVMQLQRPTSGSVRLHGVDLTGLDGGRLREARRSAQMIFQDPISSLNPLRSVRGIVSEGLEIQGGLSRTGIDRRVDEVLESVGLAPDVVSKRRPHEFSGGQAQRISIARAMVLRPALLVCDEPVSALDVSIQAQIINYLLALQRDNDLALLFIAHDLAVVKNVSDTIAVMYLGRICELGPSDLVCDAPLHPYTAGLIESVPIADPTAQPAGAGVTGELPSPLDPPSGCRFRTRCPRAQELCAAVVPPLTPRADGREVACHFPLDEPAPAPPLVA